MQKMIANINRICRVQSESVLSALSRLDQFAHRYESPVFWILGILYKFLLDALYIWVASPRYAYGGLVYHPDFLKYCISTCMYFILFALLPKREGDTPVFLFHLQFLFTVAPMLSFYALSDNSSRYMLMVFVCMLLELWILRRPRQSSGTISITGIRSYVTVMLGVLVIFALVIPPLYNGFAGLKIFDFEYIYEWRAKATYPPLFDHLVNWVYSSILPFGCIRFLQKKRYLFSVACVVAQLLLYMELGNKFILLILGPILCVYLISKTGHPLKLMYLGFCCLCLLCLIAYRMGSFSGNSLGTSLIFWISVRSLFHPADNKFKHFACFRTLPKAFFSEGQIGHMLGLTYPYGGSLGQVIHAYGGGKFLAANMCTGYLGDSYAQMGFIGMLLMSLLFAFIFRFFGAYDSKENTPILISITALYIIILNDGALFTTLLTKGLFLTFLLIFIYFEQTKGGSHGIQRK